MRDIKAMYGWRKPRGKLLRWRDGDTYPFALAAVSVKPFRLAWQTTPDFALTSMESPVRNESRTPGSVRARGDLLGLVPSRAPRAHSTTNMDTPFPNCH